MNMNVEMLAAFSLDMYPGAGSLDHLVASLLLILRTHTEHASDSGSVNLNSTIFCFFLIYFYSCVRNVCTCTCSYAHVPMWTHMVKQRSILGVFLNCSLWAPGVEGDLVCH